MMKEELCKRLNLQCQNTLVSHLGIEITEASGQSVSGKMPVDPRTCQPMGLLHGGASLALAETLASIGAMLSLDSKQFFCAGLEINANHIKPVSKGWVYGTAAAVHQGKSTQVWTVEIRTGEDELVCVSRLTLAVLEKKS